MKKRLIGLCIAALILVCPSCGEKIAAPTWQEQYDLGVRYLSEGNYEEAIIAFSTAIEIDQKKADAYVGRGDAYVYGGETEENLAAAQADYEMAIGIDETNARAWLGLADVYIRQGEYGEALEILREALEKTGSDQSIADKISEIESGNYADSSGRQRRMSFFGSGGELIYYHEYTYNADGIMDSVTSYDNAGHRTGHVDLSYDENGRPLVEYTYVQSSLTAMSESDEGIVTQLKYEYDRAGNVVREEFYGVDGYLSFYILCQYDASGKVTRTDRYDKNGTLFLSDTCTYNALGQLERTTIYDPDSNITGYELFEYDDDGNLVKFSVLEPDGSPTYYIIYKYDENGNHLGEEMRDSEGNLVRSEVGESTNG